MKSAEVLKILGVTRQTLSRYIREKRIRIEELHNGRYEYNDEDVYKIKNYKKSKSTYIYICGENISEHNISNKIELLSKVCIDNSFIVKDVIIDEDEKGLEKLIDLIASDAVDAIAIYNKNDFGLCNIKFMDILLKSKNCKLMIATEYRSPNDKITDFTKGFKSLIGLSGVKLSDIESKIFPK